MKPTKKTNKELEYSEGLQEKVKNTSDGELTDDDAQAATGGIFPIFSGLEETGGTYKPI
ncbi:MAG: hypothetical protein IK057_04680 [Clostridia bacterium]|nr:hypothetical protein [Clostridia bacterium]